MDDNKQDESSSSSEMETESGQQPQSEGISLPQMPSLNPGHVWLGISMPFLYRAYRLYHSPIDDLVEHIAKVRSQGQLKNLAELKDADISVRRAVGFGVAGRALRLGTLISFGSFFLLGGGTFLVGGWSSTQEAVVATREWANPKRKRLDQLLGVKERVDEDHPEMIARKRMTPDEERVYLIEKYLAPKKPPAQEPENALENTDNSESVSSPNRWWHRWWS